MMVRKLAGVATLIVAFGFIAAFGVPWRWAPPHWDKAPSITIVGRADDPRLPAVREAVESWNRTFAALPTTFRLGEMTRVDGAISAEDLRDAASWTLRGLWFRRHPRSFDAFGGDIVLVLSDDEFISFSSRLGDRTLVAIKNATHPPLSLPNVLPNVIAHELGHALGLEHNADPAMLMCGRPAPCRPALFASETPRVFPLTPADLARLRESYPPQKP